MNSIKPARREASRNQAADLLYDRVLPLFTEQDVPVLRILTDPGMEYSGKV